MIRLKKFIILFFVFTLSGCGFGEVGKIMRNEKINTTDEFLLKKKRSSKTTSRIIRYTYSWKMEGRKKKRGTKN